MSISSWEAYYERQQELAAEAPQLEKSEQRRARKQYECTYCRRPILKGTRYIRHFFIQDDQPHSSRQCDTCAHGDYDEGI